MVIQIKNGTRSFMYSSSDEYWEGGMSHLKLRVQDNKASLSVFGVTLFFKEKKNSSLVSANALVIKSLR